MIEVLVVHFNGRDAMKNRNKRGDIMQAALELIAMQGFHNAPISEIATKAGVAAGTIYRYFENKDLLILELYNDLGDTIGEAVRKGYPVEKSIRERFIFLLDRLFEYFLQHPLHFRYMEQYFNSPYGISLRREKALGKFDREDIIQEILEEGVSRKIMKDLPVEVLFALICGPMVVLLRDHILGFVVLDRETVGKVTEACWDAVWRSSGESARGES
jgi:TetR/AcrR family transcriptional regulator, repressor of fatR-cypB operon